MLTRKLTFFVLIIIFRCDFCYAQSEEKPISDTSFIIEQGSSLLYYVDNSFNSNQFLIPYIETELKLMTDQTNKSKLHKRLFSAVDGINYFVSADSANHTLLELFKMFNPVGIDASFDERLKTMDTSIFHRVKKAKFFLKININSFNNLLEYQFVLVKIEVRPGKNKNFFNLNKYRTTSVFIDPNSSDYKEKIKNSLRQVISEANEPPSPILSHENRVVYEDTIFSNRHLNLQANAVDADNFPDQLKYEWKIFNTKSSTDTSESFKTIGKKLDVIISNSREVVVVLHVSDGIHNVLKKVLVNLKEFPSLHILESDIAPLFYNQTLYLYSFHKYFRNHDFSSLFTKALLMTNNDYDYINWTELKHRIKIVSSVNNNSEISFYQVKLKKVGDSVLKSEDVPLSGDPFYFQASSGKLDNLKDHVYSFNILMRSNIPENIVIPFTQRFKILADVNGISSSSDFNIQFTKINRLSPYTYLSTNHFNAFGNNYSFTQVGIGLECLLLQGVSINATVGSSTSKSFSSPVVPFYRVGGNLNLYDYRNIASVHFLIVGQYRQADLYKLDTIKKIINIYPNGNRLRLGLGGLLEIGFSSSEYHPVSLSEFVTYFPKSYNLGSSLEMGLILKFSFKSLN